jgi:integrase-like protein
MDNPLIESFNWSVRDGHLDTGLFSSMADARGKLLEWPRDYNGARPHSSPGQSPPGVRGRMAVNTGSGCDHEPSARRSVQHDARIRILRRLSRESRRDVSLWPHQTLALGSMCTDSDLRCERTWPRGLRVVERVAGEPIVAAMSQALSQDTLSRVLLSRDDVLLERSLTAHIDARGQEFTVVEGVPKSCAAPRFAEELLEVLSENVGLARALRKARAAVVRVDSSLPVITRFIPALIHLTGQGRPFVSDGDGGRESPCR